VYVKVPADLTIRAEKAKSIVQDIAKVRLENSLVQSIALLWQKRDSVGCCRIGGRVIAERGEELDRGFEDLQIRSRCLFCR